MCYRHLLCIAGLTAAIFGIAATLLAFLGAFEVAYWWATLDHKVGKQVESRTNELIEQRIKEQETKFQTQIADNVNKLDAEITQLKGSFQFIKKELVITAMISPPRELEGWANELLAIDPSSEVSIRMVMNYLSEVDYCLPDPSKTPEWNTLRFTPDNDPLYYWNKALTWQEAVKEQNISAHVDHADWLINQRRPRIEAYEKREAADNQEVNH